MADFKVYKLEAKSAKSGLMLVTFLARYKSGKDKNWKSKKIPVSCQTQEEAELWMAGFMKELAVSPAKPINSDVKKQPKTVAYLAPRWLDWKSTRVSRAYVAAASTALKQWILNPAFGISELDLEADFDANVFIAWLTKVKSTPSPRTGKLIEGYTIRNQYNVLKLLVEDAMDLGWIRAQRSPFDNKLVKEENGEIPEEEKAFLTENQAQTLIDAEIPAFRTALYSLIITSGLRDSEAHGLTWSDLVLIDGYSVLMVKRQLKRAGIAPLVMLAKNVPVPRQASEPHAICCEPKSKKSIRKLVLHPLAIEALKTWKASGWKAHTGREPEDCDPIFPAHNGTFTDGRPCEELREDLVKAGLPSIFSETGKPFTFHALRRTFATFANNSGMNSFVLRYYLGHAGKTVAEVHYIGRNLKLMKSEVGKIELGTNLSKPNPVDTAKQSLPKGKPLLMLVSNDNQDEEDELLADYPD